MRRPFLSFVILGVSLCISGEYFIEIHPNNEPNFYEMKVGDVATFEVTAYKVDDTPQLLSGFSEKVWWQYNKRVLEKVSSSKTSITLRAKRQGGAELCATTVVKNNHCRKKIKISILK